MCTWYQLLEVARMTPLGHLQTPPTSGWGLLTPNRSELLPPQCSTSVWWLAGKIREVYTPGCAVLIACSNGNSLHFTTAANYQMLEVRWLADLGMRMVWERDILVYKPPWLISSGNRLGDQAIKGFKIEKKTPIRAILSCFCWVRKRERFDSGLVP